MKRLIALIASPLKARLSPGKRLCPFVIATAILFFISTRTTSAHITQLIPSATTAGVQNFTLTIRGEQLDQTDQVLWNGSPVTTIFDSVDQVRVLVPRFLIANPGTAEITLAGFDDILIFTINPRPVIITGSPLPDATPGQSYAQRLEVSGGTAPFIWSGLPAGYGLSLSPDGLISGTAIPVITTFTFEAKVTDAASVSTFKQFEIRLRYPCQGLCLFIEDVEVTEGDSSTVAAEFKVRLSSASSAPVRVDYSTQNYTAAAGPDYIAGNGTLTFNSGVTLNSIVVTVRGDTLYEAPEQFFVNLTNPVNASIGRAQGVCTILDNEPGSITFCSNDVPKRSDIFTHSVDSILSVDKDFLFDDVVVSLFLKDEVLRNYVGLFLHAPGGGGVYLVRRPGSAPGENVFTQQLGTTCSPSPDCVFDDRAPISIYDAEPGLLPYVGSFKPGEKLNSLARKNAKGTWKLTLEDCCIGDITLSCWCLKFDLPREGCRLTPERATVPIFFPHTVKAQVSSNGAPIIGQVVSFTVLGERDELRLKQDVTSDDRGVAELSYYDFQPGLNSIEARAIINGVASISRAQVTWVADGLKGFNKCPFDFSSSTPSGADPTLSTARSFRDNFLAETARGRSYTELYYQFSTEAVQIMMFNPMLMLRSREIIERYKPVIQAMANRQAVTLTRGDLDEIDGFMNSFGAKGSPELSEAIKVVSHDLRDPQMHAEFDITVTDGPKRELPAHDQLQTIKQVGGITLFFGLGGLVLFAATGNRRKALRKHGGQVLVVALSVAVVANSGGQLLVVTGQSKTGQRHVAGGQLNDNIGSLPITFEPNQGQVDPQVKFISRGKDHNLYLTAAEAVMQFGRPKEKEKKKEWEALPLTADYGPKATNKQLSTTDVLRMKLIGANSDPKITGLDRMPAVSNYLTGNDHTKWRTNVPGYARVKYENLYPGVDMLYYGDQQKLEYDFIVAPGADPGAIGLAFDGAYRIEFDATGDLVLSMSGGEVRHRKPLVYQEVNGARREVTGRYTLIQNPKSKIQNSIVGFEIGDYDRTLPLVIDPVLAYSTYLGGGGNDEGNAITVDSAGNAYVIGFTDSLNFPAANAPQSAFGGGLQDAFVVKLNPSGTRAIYSTYLGGNGQDNGSAIAVDAAGNAYITGYTGSTDFPVLNAMQPTKNGRFNAFVAKLGPTGALLYSTHLGGSAGDYGSSIAVDSSGNVYVAGVATSPNFPLAGAIQTTPGGAADVYVAKLNPAGNQLVYSTYLGGAGNDGATSLAVDSAGNLYLTGVTSSTNFRTASPLQAIPGGGFFDAFVAKLNPTGTQLLYSTYLGGSGEDRGFRIAVDPAGNAYVTGDTDSPNFPTANALQRNYAGGVDAFVAKLNPAGTALTYSTYLGGTSIEGGTAIAVDSAGNAYVTGFTGSTNFPTVGASQGIFGGGSFDGFVAKLNRAGSALDYSTHLGGSGIDSGFGIAADASGNAYVMGVTDSANFPVTNAFQPTNGGGTADLFIARLNSGPTLSNATISGKKLLVFGSGFDNGAKILIDGQVQKTANDEQNPTGALIGKKAGKTINQNQTVSLQVRNSDGALSNELRFTRP
jgi:Calx-beta domain-containing protein/beta-propeller repeat-containing protein